MKIAILGFTKIKYMPYLSMYLNELNKNDHEVHLIYWSRDAEDDVPVPKGVIGHSLDIAMEDAIPLMKKLSSIYKFGRFARRLIKSLKPDFIIVLHSTTAYTIKNLLLKEYTERYIFDYRDLTYENRFGFYGKAIKQIADHSAATFTSSDGFRHVLPDNGKIYTSHNIMPDAEQVHKEFRTLVHNKARRIRVAFWGLLRHYDINQQIIEKLCNDPRFEVHYYGRAQGKMLQLMSDSDSKYLNFMYHGEYRPEDRLQFSKDTDLLINLYERKGTELYAMGNKYYDGVTFCIPQLCTESTYMGQQCKKSNVGLSCDPYKDFFADEVYNYYEGLNREVFVQACDIELIRIMGQVRMNREIIRRVLSDGGKE
ncbi:MAG: hypothetical protein ACOYH0_09045 [Saccharofermentanales bacterium]